MADDEVEHRLQILPGAVDLEIRPALAAGGEESREVELLLIRIEGGEEVEDLVMDLVRPGIAAVDLVDHHDGADTARQRLAEHELGLRQHALGGIDQQDRAVHHAENTLHLAAEIGVAGGIDDVEAHALPDRRWCIWRGW